MTKKCCFEELCEVTFRRSYVASLVLSVSGVLRLTVNLIVDLGAPKVFVLSL